MKTCLENKQASKEILIQVNIRGQTSAVCSGEEAWPFKDPDCFFPNSVIQQVREGIQSPPLPGVFYPAVLAKLLSLSGAEGGEPALWWSLLCFLLRRRVFAFVSRLVTTCEQLGTISDWLLPR